MIEDARAAEKAKYQHVYATEKYRMGGLRRKDSVATLRKLPGRGSLLDVSCGRGDMMAEAKRLGFKPVWGTEYVQELLSERVIYAAVHHLPFESDLFDVVTMWDVMEHLIPGDDEAACRELGRVAVRHVLISTHNRPSMHGGWDLHINKRPYPEWDRLFRSWFPGSVTWIKRDDQESNSQCWRIDL